MKLILSTFIRRMNQFVYPQRTRTMQYTSKEQILNCSFLLKEGLYHLIG